jgi:hypothetical protein
VKREAGKRVEHVFNMRTAFSRAVKVARMVSCLEPVSSASAAAKRTLELRQAQRDSRLLTEGQSTR